MTTTGPDTRAAHAEAKLARLEAAGLGLTREAVDLRWALRFIDSVVARRR